MTQPARCLLGALLGAVACTGAPAGRSAAASNEDAGPGAPVLQPEGGTLRVGSVASPLGAVLGLGDDAGAADAGPDGPAPPTYDGPWTIAVPSAAMPQVLDRGGPTLSAPVLQSITFSNYDATASADDFVAHVGSSGYWQQVAGEYGVGPASAAAPVHLTSASPANIDDSQVQTWLAGEITSGALMPPSASSVYVVFYPAATNVTFNGLQSCFTMGGYHNSTLVGGVQVPYVVVPECAQDGRTTLQDVTAAASHEIFEACTDPQPLGPSPAYTGVDEAHYYFEVLEGGGELGDLCAQWPSSFFVPGDLPYLVQRTWSNVAARAGRNPCQPELAGEVFFNAVPIFSDDVTITSQSVSYATGGARIAVGATRTFDVQLYSENDVGPWTVEARNVPPTSSNLVFTWDRTTGQNGDTLHLTIEVDGVEVDFGGEPFLLLSTQGTTTNYWVGYVSQ